MKDIRENWKTLSAERRIEREDIAAYCIYKTLVKGYDKGHAKAKLLKAFKPISNINKLSNGVRPYNSLEESLRLIKYSAFSKWLEKDEMQILFDMSKDILSEGFK